jgi:hypothetical protein
MKDALGDRFLNYGDRLLQGFFRPRKIPGFYGHPNFLHDVFHPGFPVTVTKPSFFVLPLPL